MKFSCNKAFNKNKNPEKILIAVSWPYANGELHLGHLAGQNVVADVFARYHRLRGNHVLMVSGSDSHGAPVSFKAEQQGITPEELVEKSHNDILDLWEQLGFVYENYTTTQTDNHKEVAQNVFTVLLENGYLLKKTSKQYYDEEAEQFLPDRYVRGTCPECGATNARGDECPECGEYLEPEDLLEPRSTLSDSTPVIKETEHFYLDLKSMQPRLKKFIEDNGDVWRKWVREFSMGWIKQGLEPRPISRDMDYGIKLPIDGFDGKVLYVWFEAVIGYLSASIEWSENNDTELTWEDFWKDLSAKHFYFLSGGNVPFHTIIWPAELAGYNDKYQSDELDHKLPGETKNSPLTLPFNVVGNNMLFYAGKKVSKGDGTSLTIQSFLEEYPADLLRYMFVRLAPEKQDRDYTWKDLIEINNNELVGNYGNFVNRVTTLIERYNDNKVPEGKLDEEVKTEIGKAFKKFSEFIERCEFIKALDIVVDLGNYANKYINDQEPWQTIKEDETVAFNTLFNCIQLAVNIAKLLQPITPFATQDIAGLLNIEIHDPSDNLDNTDRTDYFQPQFIDPGHKLGSGELVFKKYEYNEKLIALDEAN